ncbi:hypothetical protein Btru_058399 [Bulinus truncatus]|nr:hypothetical protein Btru_058399 [Bulinus truncatus]
MADTGVNVDDPFAPISTLGTPHHPPTLNPFSYRAWGEFGYSSLELTAGALLRFHSHRGRLFEISDLSVGCWRFPIQWSYFLHKKSPSAGKAAIKWGQEHPPSLRILRVFRRHCLKGETWIAGRGEFLFPYDAEDFERLVSQERIVVYGLRIINNSLVIPVA